MVAAIRRASSLVSNFAAEALPGCLARHNQERFTVEVLIRSFESFRHTTHRVASVATQTKNGDSTKCSL